MVAVKKQKLLTKEEEIDLTNRWQKQGDIKARNIMVERNVGLISTAAKHLLQYHTMREDLFQEGVFGLIRACDKFDPTKGYRFNTYALWWIKAYVFGCAAAASVDVTVSYKGRGANMLTRARRAWDALEAAGEQITQTSMSKSLGVREDTAGGLISALKRATSLQRPIRKDSDSNDNPTLESIIPCDQPGAEEIIANEEESDLIRKHMSSLQDAYRYVLEQRFYHDKTLEQIGKVVGVTRERIRQIESSALKELSRVAKKHGMGI